MATRSVAGTSHTERGLEDLGLLWGMYTVHVAAVNANGDAGEEAETGALTVGLTGQLAASPTTATGIGNMTLTWEQPAADPDPPRTVFYAMVRLRGMAARGQQWEGSGGTGQGGCRRCEQLVCCSGGTPLCTSLSLPLAPCAGLQRQRLLACHRPRVTGGRRWQRLRRRPVCEDHRPAVWHLPCKGWEDWMAQGCQPGACNRSHEHQSRASSLCFCLPHSARPFCAPSPRSPCSAAT